MKEKIIERKKLKSEIINKRKLDFIQVKGVNNMGKFKGVLVYYNGRKIGVYSDKESALKFSNQTIRNIIG